MLPSDMPRTISFALRNGLTLDDRVFDRVYPMAHRVRSWLHWTPVDVAQRACALLAPRPGSRVLDVGSGVGKVCLVGALTTTSRWFGIERDPEMVEAANAAAVQLGVETQASFVVGDITSVDWSEFEGFYLFNPFAETLFSSALDPLARRDHFLTDVELAQQRLASAAPGTRVVTYHGLGGDMPSCFDLVAREPMHDDELRLWVCRGRRVARAS